jgi:pimaricinolide synthase PimS1
MDHLRQQVSEVVGAPPGDFDPQQGFSTLGMDSLMAVDLRNRMWSALGPRVPLPPTLFFDFPNFDALADHLVAHIHAQAEQEGVAAADRAAIPPARNDSPRPEPIDNLQSLLLKELEDAGY